MDQLTDSERRACWMLASGKSYDEIADTIGYTHSYIYEFFGDIRKRLGVPHRNALIVYLLRNGYGDNLPTVYE